MKGTILDFLNLAAEKPELAKELIELATKYDFEFAEEVSDEELEDVVGGLTESSLTAPQTDSSQSDFPDSMNTQQQAMQTLSNIMKNQHDTLKAIINNMR
jgi:hypothetical protein